jgi:cardiolipin synthase
MVHRWTKKLVKLGEVPRRLRELLRGEDEGGYCETPSEFTAGNMLSLLIDGAQTYPAMLAAIAGAKTSVELETYILNSDRTGWKFAEALAERARAGVAVRVIFDSVGSHELTSSFLQSLRGAGVLTLEYHPVAPWQRRWGWFRRDHRKILVVDGSTAFTGGMNISDDNADPSEGGGGWRDTHVKIEGPAALELERLFRTTWHRETGRGYPLSEDARRAAGKSLVRVVANEEFLHRHRIRSAYLYAIHKAERCIYIANSYFVPDRGIRRALYEAVRRGVDVRVLVPSISDVPAAAYASHHLFELHLREGVRLYAWPGPMLHAKIAVVDGTWGVAGSYNVDSRSWKHNLEANIHVVDKEFCSRLELSVVRDMERSQEMALPRWTMRPYSERVLERLFYLLRYWL